MSNMRYCELHKQTYFAPAQCPGCASQILKPEGERSLVVDLREQIAALESKEVCTQPHDDDVIEGCPYCKIEALQKQYASLLEDYDNKIDALDQEQNDHLETIDERGGAEELATQLANFVGEYFGIDVGEHSNLNCPIRNALNELNDQLAMSAALRKTAGHTKS